jgi:thymidylate synthase
LNSNYIFSNVNTALPVLMGDLLQAPVVGSRAGRVHEMTHVGITLRHPQDRYIILPDRKASLPAQIAETVWVLSGRKDIGWLSHYLPRATDFSDDGETWRAGYGPRMRAWKQHMMYDRDQLAYVVDTLRKDPLSRQAVISLWDPTVDTEPGKDIACNNWLSFSSRLGKLDLHVAVRSNDAMWGWSGINAFEWSTLQEVVAGLLGIQVGSLHFSVTSFHLYKQHWVRAHRIAETRGTVTRPKLAPTFVWPSTKTLEDFDELLSRWFQLEYDIRTGSPLVDGYVEQFPELMLRSWLRVLQWWWSKDDRSYLEPYKGTLLEQAVLASVQPKRGESKEISPHTFESFEGSSGRVCTVDSCGLPAAHPVHGQPGASPFLQYVVKLHNEKHAAYGDSWKRRGEMLGIMANIARKIDRLGGAETADETSADTAIDLMVYLAKMRTWLWDQANGGSTSDTPDAANELLGATEKIVEKSFWEAPTPALAVDLTKQFETLETEVMDKRADRFRTVDYMLTVSYALARQRWENEQIGEYRGADSD